MDLFGRRTETAALDGLLAQAADGAGCGLVLWGEPGIGKSALLDYAVDAAAEATVLRCRGTRMEASLAFAALHELLWPVRDRLETVPAPQAAALRSALGMSGEPANRFLIGAAVLSLVAGLARERPVLVVVDDAQWVDEETAQCLGFVARRVRTDPVALLVAAHEDPDAGPWEGLASMQITGLADDDARRLVDAVTPDADESLRRRTVEIATGNPLALRELPTLNQEKVLPGAIPVGPRLRRAFCARADTLKPATRALLLLAAAEERGDRHLVQRAGAGWGVDGSAWEEALRSGLLEASGARLHFRHPLIRAALYDGAPFGERQAAHRALAAGLPDSAVGERAWHLAAAADTADEHVAELLEQTAQGCLQRDAGPTAARALQRAAELSPEPADAARRLAMAARASWGAGNAGAAQRLLAHAERLVGEEPVVRLSAGLRGILEFSHGVVDRAHRYLISDMAVVDGSRAAVELGAVAVRAAWSAGRTDLQQDALNRLLSLRADDDPDLSPVMPGLKSWWSCYDETGELAGSSPGGGGDTVGLLGVVPWALLPPTLLVWAWGAEGPLRDVLGLQVATLRRRQDLPALAMVLSQNAVLDLFSGRWRAAAEAADEALRLAEEVGADHVATQCRLALARLAASRGDDAVVAENTEKALLRSVPRGVRALSASAYWIRGRAALFGGRPQEALHHLAPLDEPGHDAAHPTTALLATPDLAEAAAQLGRFDVVESGITRADAWVRRTGATWAGAAAHRLRALAGPDAERHFQAALDTSAGDDPFEHARTRLLYGEWLRRARRRADAVEQLNGAAETFGRVGATLLRDRAQRELDLAGGSSTHADAAGLTAQELRVARLASGGLTNREIAAQLLISHRTVGHHLSNVYLKLGVTSRAELARIDMSGDFHLRG